VDWIKALTELIKALAHFAWPVLVGLIVWWFRKEIRKEIAALIARISKFKGFGVEVETTQLLNDVKAEIPEAIEQVKTVLAAKSTSSATFKVNLIEGLNLLIERATTDPRNAIKRGWELLGQAVLRAAKVSGENVEPNSEEMSTSLKRLEADTQYPQELIRSIRNLQQIARKVFYQSQWAYDPSPKEAEEFVLNSGAARKDLGEKVE
jgi:hypothetical protein